MDNVVADEVVTEVVADTEAITVEEEVAVDHAEDPEVDDALRSLRSAAVCYSQFMRTINYGLTQLKFLFLWFYSIASEIGSAPLHMSSWLDSRADA